VDDDVTELEEYSGIMLRLHEHGDKTLPLVIHMPAQGRFTVGRFDMSVGVKQSDFEFIKETKGVSRRHAEFICSDDVYSVMDLGSKAGTWVNGRQIPPNTPQSLEPGCCVSFGNSGADYIFER
jgi:pSer/pThr/pTyr-binding forkhead associated (FHA) protein